MFNAKKKRLSAIISTLLLICVVFMTSAYALPVYATSSESNDILSGEIISNEMISNEMILDEIDAVDTKEISLKASDIPETLELSEMKSKGHIYRIREQENDMNSVVFLNDDSTTTKYIFSQPIKYIDSNGVVKDKSTKLVADGTDLVMADNDINVVFPQNLSQGISVKNEDDVISMVPNHASLSSRTIPQDAKSSDNNKVIYRDAFGEGIHLEYTAVLSGVKEDIILESYTGKNEFSFVINTNGLYPVKNPNGSCSFYNPSTDEIEAEMMQVFCIDAENHFAGGDITITQVIENQKYIFTVIPEVGFLTDENTVYPVTIDPTITMNKESSVEDTVIYSGKPTHNYGDHRYATVGYLDNTYKEGYYMVKFPKIATTAFYDDDEVMSAYFHIYTASGGNACLVKTHAYKYDWDEDTMTWNDFRYMIVPTLISTTAVPTGGTQKLSINITAAARGWKDEEDNTYNPDYGLVITSTNSTSSDYARDFLTVEYAMTRDEAYMPYLEINVTTEDRLIIVSKPESMVVGDEFNDLEFFVWQNGKISDRFSEVPSLFNIVSSNSSKLSYDTNGHKLIAKNPGTVRITVSERFASSPLSAYFDVTIIPDFTISSISSYTLYYETRNSYDINAYLTYDDGSEEAKDTGLCYSIEDNPKKIPVSVDENTGKVQLSYNNDGTSHITGNFTVLVKSEQVPNIKKIITFNVKCSYTGVPEDGVNEVYKTGGRYITIDHDDIAINNSSEMMNLVNSHSLGTANNRFESYIDINCEMKNEWIVYEHEQGSFDQNKRLFQLIGTSRITSIVTHGDENGNLIMNNSNNSVKFNASDIKNLHENYFKYCHLVIYTACNSADIAKTTVAKGAKSAIGFKVEIDEDKARCFEYTFMSLLRNDNAYILHESGHLEYSPVHNMTIREAVDMAAYYARISTDDIEICGEVDKTISQLEAMS